MSLYAKPFLSYAEQVGLLRSRGMDVEDDLLADATLSNIGYYRLSGYWYPFRERGSGQRADSFVDGTAFSQVVALYEFDRQLKLLVLDAVERVEIAMRVRLGHVLGELGTFAHLDATCLDPQFTRRRADGSSPHADWLVRVETARARSREEFVSHFAATYGGRMPTRVVTEIMDFGCMAALYSGAPREVRDAIAFDLRVVDHQGAGNGPALVNWLRVTNHLRNVCAHHSRLWNRNMTVQVAPKHLGAIPDLRHLRAPGRQHDRVSSALSVLAYLARTIDSDSTWAQQVRDHIDRELPPTGRHFREMGLGERWRTEALWS